MVSLLMVQLVMHLLSMKTTTEYLPDHNKIILEIEIKMKNQN